MSLWASSKAHWSHWVSSMGIGTGPIVAEGEGKVNNIWCPQLVTKQRQVKTPAVKTAHRKEILTARWRGSMTL